MTDVANLVLAVNSTQVKAGEQSLDRLTAAGSKAEGASRRLTSSFDTVNQSGARLTSSLTSARGALNAFVGALALRELGQFAGKLYEAAAQAERLRMSFGFSFKQTAGRELQYVTDLAQTLGLELQSTAAAYGKLSAAARGTSLAGEGTRAIFEAVSKASITMGLSAEQTGGALLALEQMISKGTVSSEELRGQLGERLPGAFQIAARAMGVTTQELGDMLQAGQVLAEDFLPKFAKQLQIEIGDSADKAADRLDAATNRMSNAFNRLMRAASESGISQFLKSLAQGAANDMTAISEAMERRRAAGGGMAAQLNDAAGMAIGRTFGLQNFSDDFKTLDAQLASAIAKVNELNAKPKLSLWERSDLGNAERRIAALTAEKIAREGAANDYNAQDARLIASGKALDAQTKSNAASELELAETRRKLAGVDKDYLPTLTKLQQQRAAGLLSDREYISIVSDLAQKNYKKSEAEKASAAAAKDAAAQYEKSVEYATDFIETLQNERAEIGLTTAQLKMVTASRFAALAPTEQLRVEIMKEALALDIATKAHAENTKTREYVTKATKELLDESNREIDAIYGQIEATRMQINTFGMAASAVTGATIAQLEYKLSLLEVSDWEGIATQALRDRITALRELQGLQGNKEALEGQKRMTDDLEKDAKASHERIAQSLTDNIMRGGKSAGEYLKDYFRTLILRPIIQPVGNAVAGMLNGSGGLSSLMGIGSGLGSMLNTAGSFFGLNSLSNFGAGMQGATLAPGLAGPTTAGAGGATGLGAQIGSAMPMIAAAVASYFGARAISNGYEINGIGKLLNFGGLAGGLLNRAFGMRPRENGLGGFQGNFSDAGFTNGQTFQRWHQSGGWFRSDREGTDYGALDANFAQQLTDTYTALRDANTQYAESLGLTTDAVRGYAKEFILALSGNEAQDAQTLAVEFAKINNELAERLLPNFAEFARTGEDAATTLQRLAVEYRTVDAVLTAIGDTFGAVGIGSAAARSRLIELSGGLEAFTNGAAFFAENFLTEAQRLEPVQAAVTAEMSRLGLASVTTHEQFVQAARGIDKTTEAGAQLYADMMRIAGAFDTVADAEQRRADAISEERVGLQQRLNELTLTSAELLQLQRDALDESNRGLFDQITAIEAQRVAAADAARDAEQAAQDYADTLQTALDTAMDGVSKAFSGLQRSVQAERDAITKAHTEAMDAINERIQTVTGSIGKLTQLSNSLRSTLDRMRLPSQFGADRAAAQAQIAAAVAIARAGGVLPDADEIGRALNTLTQPAERMFRSSFEFQRDAIRNQNMIAELATLTDDQLTTEQQMLSALEDSRDLAQATYEGEMSRLDGILTSAQLQIDILNGLDVRLLTIDQSLARFAGSLTTAGAAQAAVAGNTGGTAATVTGLFSNILGREARPEGAAFWTNALATNSTYLTGQNSIVRDFIEGAVNAGGIDAERAIAYARANGIPGFSSGGETDGGAFFAGESGRELIMSGPRTVVNATSTRRMMQDASDLVVAVRELIATVNEQGSMQEARDVAIVKHVSTVARIANRWDGNGVPVRAHADIPLPVDTTP